MQRDEVAVAPIQPEKKLKRETSILPAATPVVQVHHIEVTPRNAQVESLAMPLSTPRSHFTGISHSPMVVSPRSPLTTSSMNITSSSSALSSFTPPSVTASCTTVPLLPALSSANINSTSVMNTDNSNSLTTAVPSRFVSRSTMSHRPFKKEATDKWVSALALLELAQGGT